MLTSRVAFLFLACAQVCLAQVTPEHRIGVRVVDGVGQFYLRDSGAAFIPRGNNHIRLATQTKLFGGTIIYHSLFNVGLYDPSDVEAVLSRMQSDGYNTVRVFLNGCCSGGIGNTGGTGLSQAYLANVADFLTRAKSHGLWALVGGDWVPEAGGYSGVELSDPNFVFPNIFFLTSRGIRAYSKYWTDVITGLAALNAPLDAVFAWEIQNEIHFASDALPLSLTSGTVTTANSKTYDLSSSASRQAMMDENLVYFIDQVRSAIKTVDPTALVTVSFFRPQSPNPTRIGDPRLIRTYPAIANSTADFIGLHTYILDLTLAQLVQNYESAGLTAKPLVMGEFGTTLSNAASAESAAAQFQKWQVDSCSYGFSGWLLWTWDLSDASNPNTNFWSAMSGGGVISRALAPVTRPDPCKPGSYPGENVGFGATATASNSAAGQGPAMAVDGWRNTWWSAGAFPPQWIELRLPRPTIISGVRLTVSQFPSGPTLHRLYVRTHDGQARLVREFNGVTQAQQVLTWNADTPITGIESVRVETVSSPSWVAWREIEVFSADTSQPSMSIRSVTNGATFDAAITPGSWATIFGTGLAGSSRTWQPTDFVGPQLPTVLDGVTVSFNGVPGFLYFISPTQLNVQVPSIPTGQPVTVIVARNNVQSAASARADSSAYAPGLFSYIAAGVRYAAAKFPDGVVVGDPAATPGTRGAKPGDHVSLYGTGFGISPSGVIISIPTALPDPVVVTIGGRSTSVEYAGLVGAGLFQINVVIPDLPVGDHAVAIQIQNVSAAAPPLIPVRFDASGQ